ncbi:MAG: M50 family metallopeptidase [Planctomycetaceae bacterium]
MWYPVLALVLCWRLGLRLGALCEVLLLLSTVLHEFFHVFAARWTGGSADEILIWPAGGLAFTRPAPGFRSEFLTSAAGPFSNLLLCVAMLPAVLGHMPESGQLPAGLLHPVELVAVDLEHDFWGSVALLTFDLNWLLLLINLIPVYPLDGGQMLQSILAARWVDAETARFAALRIGMILGLVGAVLGLVFDQIWLVFVGFFIFCMDLHEFFVLQMSDQLDDSFLGYDFSQGYTSLERSQTGERRGSFLQRWRQKRAARKREREEQERVETEQLLDELLDKVHREGIQSLTDAERRFLQKASTRYKSGDRPNRD